MHMSASPVIACTRHAFGGCQGDGGQTCRNCPGKAEAEAFRDIERQPQSDRWLYMLLALAVIGGIFGFANSMARVERAEQIARV